MKDIPITIDYKQDIKSLIGKLLVVEDNPEAKVIYDMLKKGYTFEIGAGVLDDEILEVSILSSTGKKIKRDPLSSSIS